MNDTHSLSHTKWNCKYQGGVTSKYRRKVFFEDNDLREEQYLENYVIGKM